MARYTRPLGEALKTEVWKAPTDFFDEFARRKSAGDLQGSLPALAPRLRTSVGHHVPEASPWQPTPPSRTTDSLLLVHEAVLMPHERVGLKNMNDSSTHRSQTAVKEQNPYVGCGRVSGLALARFSQNSQSFDRHSVTTIEWPARQTGERRRQIGAAMIVEAKQANRNQIDELEQGGVAQQAPRAPDCQSASCTYRSPIGNPETALRLRPRASRVAGWPQYDSAVAGLTRQGRWAEGSSSSADHTRWPPRAAVK
jgi:hypothetical protein